MTNQSELIPLSAGEMLALERERAGLSLEQAAERCRMKTSLIAAIERGETATIPSVYLKGYIRNYARGLGIDPSEVENRLASVSGFEPSVRSVFTAVPPRGRGEKWLKATSYLAASAVIAALAWQFTHEAVRFSQGETQMTAGSAVTAEDGQPAATGEDAPRRPLNTHLNASIASVELLQHSRDRGGKAAAEEAWAAIGSEATPAALAPGMHRLLVTTSGDSWVEILDGDGAQLEMDLVRAGSTREYVGAAPLQVMIGRASAVLLSVDGEAVDLAPHQEGDVARLTVGAELAATAEPPGEPADR